MTVMSCPEALSSAPNDGHRPVLDFCDGLLRLCAYVWRSRWPHRSSHDCRGRHVELDCARPAGDVDRDQLAGHGSRFAPMDRPNSSDALQSALLANLDGGSSVVDRGIASCNPRHVRLHPKKLRRAGNGLGHPLSSMHGWRGRSGSSRIVEIGPAIVFQTVSQPQHANPPPQWTRPL